MIETEKITILIADDHCLFRKGIISMFDKKEEVEFIAEASSGNELIDKYITHRPDIILADISMPVLPGNYAVKKLFDLGYRPKVLFLSMDNSDEKRYVCHKAGALGLIGKNASREELLEAIISVYYGRHYFGCDWNEDKRNSLTLKYKGKVGDSRYEYSSDILSWREKQIMLFIGEGYPSNEIADKMNLAKRTVDSYRASILKKLGLRSLSELVVFAAKNQKVLSGQ